MMAGRIPRLFWVCLFALADMHAPADAQRSGVDVFGNIVGEMMRGAAEAQRRAPAQDQTGPFYSWGAEQSRAPTVARSAQRANPSVIYMVAGHGLGDRLEIGGPVYRQYQCFPSGQFQNLTWCRRATEERSAQGEYQALTTLLHDEVGQIVFVERSIKPAFFAPGDFGAELDRLSRLYLQAPTVQRHYERATSEEFLIARWGEVRLMELDGTTRTAIRQGERINGISIGFHADKQLSLRYDTPLFQVVGGPGFIWSAGRDASGRGHLRFMAADPSRLRLIETRRPPVAKLEDTPRPARSERETRPPGPPPLASVPAAPVPPAPAPSGPAPADPPKPQPAALAETAVIPGPIPKTCPARSADYPARYSLVKQSIEATQQRIDRWKSLRKSVEDRQRTKPESLCEAKQLDDIKAELTKMPAPDKRTEEDAGLDSFDRCLDAQLQKVEQEIDKLQGQPDPVGLLLRTHGELIRVKIEAGLLTRGYKEAQGTLNAVRSWFQAGVRQCSI